MSGMDYSGIVFLPRKGLNPKVIAIKEFEELFDINFCGKTGLSYRRESLKDQPVVRPWDIIDNGLYALFRLIKVDNIENRIYYGFYGYQVGEGYLDTNNTRAACFEMLLRLRDTRPNDSAVNKFIKALKSGEG